jgi:hypothetical protein
MRMPKTWDRVTMTWDCFMGIHTSVTMNGEFDPSLHNPRVFSTRNDEKLHGLFAMESISQSYDEEGLRRGEISIDVRCKGPNLTPNSDAIVKFVSAKLDKLLEEVCPVCEYKIQITPPQTRSWTDTKFILPFILAKDTHFCDASIEIGRAVFEGLGVKDENGYYLARFEVKRDTFVRLDDVWITFPRWLRIAHRLPIIGPEDRKK